MLTIICLHNTWFSSFNGSIANFHMRDEITCRVPIYIFDMKMIMKMITLIHLKDVWKTQILVTAVCEQTCEIKVSQF